MDRESNQNKTTTWFFIVDEESTEFRGTAGAYIAKLEE